MYQLLYEDIAQKIEDQIHQSVYKEGDKLPSERELAEEYGVSRNVIREVIGTLREHGYAIVKPGKGAYITKLNNIVVTETLKRMLQSDDPTGEEILEVREDLEIAIIRKAVQKREVQDIQALKNIYNKMEKNRSFVNQFIKDDSYFHITLAKATQNNIYPLLIQSLFDITEGSIFTLTRLLPYSVDDAQNHHSDLIQAIETMDERLGVSVIKNHMDLLRNEVTLLKKQNLL
ncbi:FadR/GntR family transcriptional regulator [Lentibacillus halophilus]|uniref:FadR/GntR family transcriptional regulator n=1 Tax=Lentibacillus halophilus TaxID=295065 RepID=A0ABP3IYT4_9BACI